jgi:UDP-N-acetyl-D-glucosamine dehydrogenase
MGIDIWEVIQAASTKPFGFMPFYPGPGVGGHRIPINPFYLSWKAREFDFHTRFVELAAEINDSMPFHTADLVRRALESHGLVTRNAAILLVGVAFKRDVDDTRNAPARRVAELLLARGARVSYHDPHVKTLTIDGKLFGGGGTNTLSSVCLSRETLQAAAAVVILTPHTAIDFDLLVREVRVLVDATGATRGSGRKDIWRLGAPPPNALR